MTQSERKKPTYNSVYFHLDKSLETELQCRASPGAPATALALIAKRDVARYYVIMRQTLQGLNLEKNEALLLCEILKDTVAPADVKITRKHLEKFISLFPRPRKKNAAAALQIRPDSISKYLNNTLPVGAQLQKQMRAAGYNFTTETLQKTPQTDTDAPASPVLNIVKHLEIADESIFQKWDIMGIDRNFLIDKIYDVADSNAFALSMAILDAVERFWLDNETLGTPDNPYGERLRRAGFIFKDI